MFNKFNKSSFKKWARKVLRIIVIVGHIGAAIHGADFIIHTSASVVGTTNAKVTLASARF